MAEHMFTKLTSRHDGYDKYCKRCKAIENTSLSSYLSKMLSRAKQRAKKAEVPFELSVHDIQIPEKCPVLGIPLVFGNSQGRPQPEDTSPSLDRIVPELGYVPGNVAVISTRANRVKNDSTLDELRMLVEWMEHQ